MSGNTVSADAIVTVMGLGAAGGAVTGAAVAILFASPVAAGIICGGLLVPVAVLTLDSIERNYPTQDGCVKVMQVVLALLAAMAVGFAISALFGISITFIEAARIDVAITAIAIAALIGILIIAK